MSQTCCLAAILAADVARESRLMGEDNGEIGQCGKPGRATAMAFSHRVHSASGAAWRAGWTRPQTT
jgi:hypothetical protein